MNDRERAVIKAARVLRIAFLDQVSPQTASVSQVVQERAVQDVIDAISLLDQKSEECDAKSVDMRECGRPIEFLSAAQAISRGLGEYSGWYHADTDWTDHHAVPKSWVR